MCAQVFLRLCLRLHPNFLYIAKASQVWVLADRRRSPPQRRSPQRRRSPGRRSPPRRSPPRRRGRKNTGYCGYYYHGYRYLGYIFRMCLYVTVCPVCLCLKHKRSVCERIHTHSQVPCRSYQDAIASPIDRRHPKL